MRRLIEGKKNAIKAKYKPNMTLKRSPTPRRLKKIQHTARSGKGTARSGSRPVSRALAARMNAVERVRLGTARRNAEK